MFPIPSFRYQIQMRHTFNSESAARGPPDGPRTRTGSSSLRLETSVTIAMYFCHFLSFVLRTVGDHASPAPSAPPRARARKICDDRAVILSCQVLRADPPVQPTAHMTIASVAYTVQLHCDDRDVLFVLRHRQRHSVSHTHTLDRTTR